MNVIYPYCKGALFDYIKVATLVVYATNNQLHYDRQKPAKNPMQKLPKNPWQKLAKNPMRTKICLDHAKIFCENFNIKILNTKYNARKTA